MPRDDDRDEFGAPRPRTAAGPNRTLYVVLGVAGAFVATMTLACVGGLVAAALGFGLFARKVADDADQVRQQVQEQQAKVKADLAAADEAAKAGPQLLTVTTVRRSHGRGGRVTLEVVYELHGAEVVGDTWVVVKRMNGTVSRTRVRDGFRKTTVPGAVLSTGGVEVGESGLFGDGFQGSFDVWVERGGTETDPGTRVSNVFPFR